jgi:hypothetical protein
VVSGQDVKPSFTSVSRRPHSQSSSATSRPHNSPVPPRPALLRSRSWIGEHLRAGMATIRIADPIKPVKSIDERRTREDIGGVYNTRAISLERRSTTRALSLDLRSTRGRRDSVDRNSKAGDDVEAEDEDSDLRQAGDFKKKQVCLILSSICL